MTNPTVGGHARWHEKEGKEERKKRRGLPQAPTTSLIRNLGRHSEGVHSFSKRREKERGERKAAAQR